jgi:hypothetical protein
LRLVIVEGRQGRFHVDSIGPGVRKAATAGINLEGLLQAARVWINNGDTSRVKDPELSTGYVSELLVSVLDCTRRLQAEDQGGKESCKTKDQPGVQSGVEYWFDDSRGPNLLSATTLASR